MKDNTGHCKNLIGLMDDEELEAIANGTRYRPAYSASHRMTGIWSFLRGDPDAAVISRKPHHTKLP